jgi:hypothetical protein
MFFTMFTDDFGTYGKVMHKTNGKYVSLGNLPYAMQCLLRNVLALTLAPPGTPPEVASEAFAQGLRDFSFPRVMDLGPKLGKVIVVGGLGVLFVDTPEGQDIIGNMRQNCGCGCRECLCPKDHTDDLEANFPLRTDFNMDQVRREAVSAPTKTASADLLKQAGLHERGFLFANLPLNQWEVVPYDVFHLIVIGLLTLLLSIFCTSLEPTALLELNWLLTHARPIHWPVIPLFVLTASSSHTSAYQRLKGCGESVRMQIQLLPLLLASWLDITKFRKLTWRKALITHHGTENAVVIAVRESIFAMANAYSAVFALTMPNTTESISNLQSAVDTGRRLMKSCWSGVRKLSFAKTTNFHSASHISSIARRFGLTPPRGQM